MESGEREHDEGIQVLIGEEYQDIALPEIIYVLIREDVGYRLAGRNRRMDIAERENLKLICMVVVGLGDGKHMHILYIDRS